jgi:2-hydroxycyclohexanecarboxyl-CoA dehydrogenase
MNVSAEQQTAVLAARVVIVTGAARGIGQSCAVHLRNTGWLVAGFDLAECPGVDLSIQVDVADTKAIEDAVALVTSTLGAPFGIVSAAGYVEEIPLSELTPDRVQRMLRVHLGGLINLIRAAIPQIKVPGGSVVAVASEMALIGGESAAHYVAAKGAILGIVRALAEELADRGVTINAVAPGPTDTVMLAADSVWRDSSYLATLPTRALVSPTEIALTVEFLLRNPSKLTGELISPNAGTVM